MSAAFVEDRLTLAEAEMRKVNALVKDAAKLSSTASEDRTGVIDALLSGLDTLEVNMSKLDAVIQMNEEEAKSYDALAIQIESQIEQTANEIEASRIQLASDQAIKRQKQEYNAVARTILRQPARAETQSHINRLDEELRRLDDTVDLHEAKIAQRQQQFSLLYRAAQDLQAVLSGPQEDADAMDERKEDASADEDEENAHRSDDDEEEDQAKKGDTEEDLAAQLAADNEADDAPEQAMEDQEDQEPAPAQAESGQEEQEDSMETAPDAAGAQEP